MASTITADNGVSSGSAGLKSSADSSGVLALASGTGTTAVTIDASQNVGIGTSSPAGKLHIYAPAATTNFTIQSDASNLGGIFFSDGSNNTGAVVYDQASDYMYFRTNGSERARIDSSGNLLVGTTSTINTGTKSITVQGSGGGVLSLSRTDLDGTSRTMAGFYTNTTAVGAINCTTSATSYATSSDHRLKENVQPMVGALDKVAALKPCTYNWKVDGSEGQGFIAHELQSVVPDCVTGEKDAIDADGNPVYQGIDTSFLVATLTAAIQEQQALITTLTERIAALEAK